MRIMSMGMGQGTEERCIFNNTVFQTLIILIGNQLTEANQMRDIFQIWLLIQLFHFRGLVLCRVGAFPLTIFLFVILN